MTPSSRSATWTGVTDAVPAESLVAPALTGCSGYVVTVDTGPLELVVVLAGLVCVPVVWVPVVEVVVWVLVDEVVVDEVVVVEVVEVVEVGGVVGVLIGT
jgi:hypothetical protein